MINFVADLLTWQYKRCGHIIQIMDCGEQIYYILYIVYSYRVLFNGQGTWLNMHHLWKVCKLFNKYALSSNFGFYIFVLVISTFLHTACRFCNTQSRVKCGFLHTTCAPCSNRIKICVRLVRQCVHRDEMVTIPCSHCVQV